MPNRRDMPSAVNTTPVGSGFVDPAPAPALTAEHMAQLAASSVALRKARRAAGVAKFSGWTLAIFALVTALGGMTDPVSLGTAAGLGVLSWSELKGARGVQRFDTRASKRLVWNQLILLALIIVYAGVNLWLAQNAGTESSGDAQVDEMMADYGDLMKMVSMGLYACVAAIGVPVQIIMALYHARRGRQLAECLRQTPPWIIQVARAA